MSVANAETVTPSRGTPRTLAGAVSPREFRRPLRSSATRLRLANPAVWTVVGAASLLSILGAYSIALAGGVRAEGMGALASRQCMYIALGVVLGACVAIPHYRRYAALAWPALGAAGALLVFLLLPFVPTWLVTPRNGARAWIDLGVISLQPAEVAKLAVILALARYLRFRDNYRRLLGFLPPFVITLAPVCLIILQPDLGSALLFIPALFAMLLAAGAKLKHIALIVVLGLALAPAAYPFLMPHQKERIQAMVRQVQGDVSQADTTQYQSLKAITLVGAGGVAGLGAEHSRAVIDFNDLPEQHNDMIYAVIVNRFGLLGGLVTLALAGAFIAGGLLIAATSKDPFGRLVAVGLVTIMGAQTIVNIGVCLGVLPVVGVTLPFVSYGGSSMLASWVGVGLLVNIGVRPPERMPRRSFEHSADD